MTKKTKNKFSSKFFALVGGLVVLAVAVITAVILMQPKTFRLDDEYYGSNESIDVDKEAYEKLIADKKSFIIMVDKPECYTTANMRQWMSEFPEDMRFKYYRIMWGEASNSSLHEQIKFVPAVALIHDGKVVDFLDADSDEDAPMYNDPTALQNWIREYVEF